MVSGQADNCRTLCRAHVVARNPTISDVGVIVSRLLKSSMSPRFTSRTGEVPALNKSIEEAKKELAKLDKAKEEAFNKQLNPFQLEEQAQPLTAY